MSFDEVRCEIFREEKFSFRFIYNTENDFFFSYPTVERPKDIIQNLTRRIIQDLDKYFKNCYLWAVPKQELTIQHDSIKIPLKNAVLVCLDKESLCTHQIRSIGEKYDNDVSVQIEKVERAIANKRKEIEKTIDRRKRINFTVSNFTPDIINFYEGLKFSYEGIKYFFDIDNDKFVYLNIISLDTIFFSPCLKISSNSPSFASIVGDYLQDGEYVPIQYYCSNIEFKTKVKKQCQQIIKKLFYQPNDSWDRTYSIWRQAFNYPFFGYKLTHKFIYHKSKLYKFDIENNDVYVFTESHSHYSDSSGWYGTYTKAPDSSTSFLIVSKHCSFPGYIDITLRTTNSSLSTYSFSVEEKNRELATYFLLKYFSADCLENKRLNFPSKEVYEEFGIDYFHKRKITLLSYYC